MNWMDIPLFAFLALGAENVLFTGGAGLSRAMRAARRPGLTRWYALFVTLFGAAVMELSVLVNPLLELTPLPGLFRPAVFALLCALLYAAAAALLRRFRPSFYRRVSPVLSPAAINCVVLSLPFYQSSLAAGPLAALGFALGTGLSFLAASVVLRELLANSRRSGVPEAFLGTPLMLLVIGLISLAFLGFRGI